MVGTKSFIFFGMVMKINLKSGWTVPAREHANDSLSIRSIMSVAYIFVAIIEI